MRKQLQPRKEREGETSSKAMASMLATASIVVRYLDRRKNEREREREREAKKWLPLSRASICIVITITFPTGDGSLLARKKNSLW